MTGYRLSQRYKAGIVYVTLLIISLVMFFTTTKDLSFNPKTIGVSVFGTLQKGLSGSAHLLKDTFNSIAELRDLQAEYQQLQNELSRLRPMQRDYTALKDENRQLRKQLGYSEQTEFSFISAQVIGKDPSDFFSGITIDKGYKDDVQKNAAVIAYTDGFQGLVGRITEISPYNSKIQPIYERESYIAARLQSSRYEGLIEGNDHKDHSLLMRYVIKRAKDNISFGDIIITSGMNSIFPPNIYIGRIREIRSKDWNPDIELLIEPIVDFDRLEYVYIVSPKNEE